MFGICLKRALSCCCSSAFKPLKVEPEAAVADAEPPVARPFRLLAIAAAAAALLFPLAVVAMAAAEFEPLVVGGETNWKRFMSCAGAIFGC